MRYYFLSLITLVCLVCSNSYSQNKAILSIDSLKKINDKTKTYKYNYRYSDAIKSSFKLIEEAKKSNNIFYEFRGLIELGTIHHLINDSTKAKMYNLKALEKAKQSQTDSLIAWAYNDLADVQVVTLKNYKKLIGYYEKAIAIYTKNPTSIPPIAEQMNICDAYLIVDLPEKAYPYLIKAEALSNPEEQHELLILNLNILSGRYYYGIKDYKKAIKTLESALSLAEKKFLNQASEIYPYLAMAYEETDNLSKTNYYLKQQNKTNKELNRLEKEVLIAETNAKFEISMYQKELKTTKKERDISSLLVEKSKSLNIITTVLSIILLVGLIAIFVLAANRKKYINALSKKNTELINAKNKAEHLSKLKTQFFSTISHEIRTPLYGVIGLSSILLEDKELSKTHKTDLTSLKFSADYLLALINDVLMLSKMENNGIKLEKTPFKLNVLLNSITQSFAFILEQNNNKIITDIDPKLPNALIADSIRLSQILMNLIGNAAKFNENGTIWISITLLKLTKTGKYISKFIIKDDGIGIPIEKQKSIFDEFSQVRNDAYTYQGTGLGLPIVVKLLALHGSKINLDSKPNIGSTFSFTLALEANLAVTKTTDTDLENTAIEAIDFSFKDCHILIVDDNKINQKITKKILEKKNFNCSIANDGQEAISLVKENKYQLVLMDINMPKINGYEATKAIRLFDKTTPIVALTAVEANEIRDKIIQTGMNDFILKPYDNSQFFTTILKHLN